MTDVVLDVRDLRTHFFTRQGIGKAVDGVSFRLRRGRTLGLVGESGCGKSMTALSILQLHPQPASRIVGGQVLFEGEDLLQKSPSEMTRYRGKRLGLVLQDPTTALDPLFTIGDQVAEPLRLHKGMRGKPLREKIIELLRLLRISAAEQRLDSYPHQLSGGMRQRVVVLIADEPTTALDVTVQAAYLALLREIQRRTDLAILFITHDFGVVARMCDDVAVMYAGKIVEQGPTSKIFERPAHPYTEALLRSVPDVRRGTERLVAIPGSPPSIFRLGRGCAFAERCPFVMDRCRRDDPVQLNVGVDRVAACWRHA